MNNEDARDAFTVGSDSRREYALPFGIAEMFPDCTIIQIDDKRVGGALWPTCSARQGRIQPPGAAIFQSMSEGLDELVRSGGFIIGWLCKCGFRKIPKTGNVCWRVIPCYLSNSMLPE